MNEFTTKTDDLKRAVDEIAASIETITDAIEDGARGVTGAAEARLCTALITTLLIS